MGGTRRKLLPVLSRSAGQGVYVYCVVNGATTPKVMAGRDGRLPDAAAPRAIAFGSRTWLVVADVPLDTYGERSLDSRLKDVEWVSAVGVAHQVVVDACLRSDAVVPMKLFTIFASDARAIDAMTRQMSQLNDAMQRVAGCVEWGVRVTRALEAPAPAPASTVTRRSTSTPEGAGGRAFLEAKAQQRRAIRDAAAALDQDVRALSETLDGMTRDVRYRADDGGASAPLLLDAAYLVSRDGESRFRSQLRAKARPLLARGCRVTVTCPWPPYSFVSPAPPPRVPREARS